jgi:hypothetical protein
VRIILRWASFFRCLAYLEVSERVKLRQQFREKPDLIRSVGYLDSTEPCDLPLLNATKIFH